MTDYTIISRYRNKDAVETLVASLRAKGKTCYNFCDIPGDPHNPDASVEAQMQAHESVVDFYNDPHFKSTFETDLAGLKNATTVIMLLPAGNAAHMEAGIAYGLGKKLILIGEIEKPETLYLIFEERYKTTEEFLETV